MKKDGLNTDREMAYSSKCKTILCVVQTRDIRHLPRWASEAWKLYSDTLDVMIQAVKICTQNLNSFVCFLNNKISLCTFFNIKNAPVTSKKAKAQGHQAHTWWETQCCQFSWIIRDAPDFEPLLPVSRLESEISRIIAKFAFSCRLDFLSMKFQIFCIVWAI